jgi:hypothetical protein
LRRDRIDFQKAEDDFMRDIGIDYQLDVLQRNFKPSKQTLIIDKHWPLHEGKLTLTLGFGVIWQGAERYSGTLANNQSKFTFIFRPNIKF